MKGILLPRNYFKFPFVKVIVSKIACKSLYNTKNEHFLTAYHQKVVREIFSGASGMSYRSKTCSNQSGLSIAATPNWFGHVQAKNGTIEKRWITYPVQVPLKKNTHILSTHLSTPIHDTSTFWDFPDTWKDSVKIHVFKGKSNSQITRINHKRSRNFKFYWHT